MIRIKTIRIRTARIKTILIISILIIAILYIFPNILVMIDRLDFIINHQAVLEDINSSGLVEVNSIKDHIHKVIPIVQVAFNNDLGDTAKEDIGLFTELTMGFNLKYPVSILSSQVLLIKKYEPEIVSVSSNRPIGDFIAKKENSNSELASLEANPNVAEETKLDHKNQSGNQDDKESEQPVSGEAADIKQIQIKNETNKSINVNELLNEDYSVSFNNKGPHILIIHTHTSEAYQPTSKNHYSPSDPDRTEDPNYNVVRIGEEITEGLKSLGVEVIHDKTIHDFPVYNGSYGNALKTIQANLKKYPSIEFVLDIHRDAVSSENGQKLKVTTNIDNRNIAQVMLVVGTDESGLAHPNWKENLKFALKIQHKFQTLYPGLIRPLHLTPYRYNQHATNGSLILEVGGNGNTLEEAVASGQYITKVIAEVIKEVADNT